MKKVKRILKALIYPRLLIFFLTAFYLILVPFVLPQEEDIPFRRPDASVIEKKLFEHINQERKKRKLFSLKHSAELSALARKHSQDMATISKLTHLSSSGDTYAERLVRNGFHFMDIGENVAFSETFQADFIHQSLMDSQEHMENILMPQFDQVGVGVIYVEKKGYYITQDFLQSFQRKAVEDIKRFVQRKIDKTRQAHALLPLAYIKEADEFALTYSMNKAEKKRPPPFPPSFGEVHVISLATPSLDDTESVFEEVLGAFYRTGGLGVWFGRNKDYPGGAYFITLLLFPEIRYKNMEERALNIRKALSG